MKLRIKEDRQRVVSATIIALSAIVALQSAGICVTGALAWHMYRTQRTVTTPMNYDTPFSADATTGNARLFSMLARSFINLRLSVTPETVDGNHQALLRWVPPAARSALKKQLDVEAAYIKKNGISSVFSITGESVNTTDGSITVKGTLTASTTNGNLTLPDGSQTSGLRKDVNGTIALPDVNRTYRLSIQYIDGSPLLNLFSEVLPVPVTTLSAQHQEPHHDNP